MPNFFSFFFAKAITGGVILLWNRIRYRETAFAPQEDITRSTLIHHSLVIDPKYWEIWRIGHAKPGETPYFSYRRLFSGDPSDRITPDTFQVELDNILDLTGHFTQQLNDDIQELEWKARSEPSRLGGPSRIRDLTLQLKQTIDKELEEFKERVRSDPSILGGW